MDGHGQCENFYIESTAPVEQVREAYFKAKDQFGLDLEKVFDDESYLSGNDRNKLAKLGFGAPQFFKTFFKEDSDKYFSDPCGAMEIWRFLIHQVDPSIVLRDITEDFQDQFHFCGTDEKGRHIKAIGYGFWDPMTGRRL